MAQQEKREAGDARVVEVVEVNGEKWMVPTPAASPTPDQASPESRRAAAKQRTNVPALTDLPRWEDGCAGAYR